MTTTTTTTRIATQRGEDLHRLAEQATRMDQAPGTQTLTTSRARWAQFADRAAAAGRGDVENYVNDQAGCWTLTDDPSLPLDADRARLWQALMHGPACPACDGYGCTMTGAPCRACDGAGELPVAV